MEASLPDYKNLFGSAVVHIVASAYFVIGTVEADKCGTGCGRTSRKCSLLFEALSWTWVMDESL